MLSVKKTKPINNIPRNALIVIGCLLVITAAIFGSNKFAHKLTEKTSETKNACNSTATTHTAIIENDQITPAHTVANRCDKLIIINKDSKIRVIAFGKHNQHVAYDGVSEKPVMQGKSLAITLDTAGTYLFHDHRQEDVKATFTVNP